MLQKTKLTNSPNKTFGEGGHAPSVPGFGDVVDMSTGDGAPPCDVEVEWAHADATSSPAASASDRSGAEVMKGSLGSLSVSLRGERREHHPFGIAERDRASGGELAGELARQVEGDGDRPQGAVRQAHVRRDGVVVGLAEEAGQRREGAVQQELQIAELAGRQIPRRPVTGGGLELGAPLRRCQRTITSRRQRANRSTSATGGTASSVP